MRVVQTFGIPDPSMQLHDVDCIVVSLKTRSVPAAEAVKQSLAAAHALKIPRRPAALLQILLHVRLNPGRSPNSPQPAHRYRHFALAYVLMRR
jgi:hypothetical protein